ncbi:MAG: hypothetical protein ACRC1P_07730, partial [Cellulosilyticaceae bacterium]
MNINFKVEPLEGILHADVIIQSNYCQAKNFYLNRDFEVENIICDGVQVPIIIESIEMKESRNYKINRYILPLWNNQIKITYSGSLTGETGCAPYAKEKITSEFTLLRLETFCYPIFLEDIENDLYGYISNTNPERVLLAIDVPKDYIVTSTGKAISCEERADRRYWLESTFENKISLAIAKFVRKQLDFGDFYFLNSTEQICILEETMNKVYTYMNEHFGLRKITSNIKYITIPDGLGSYVSDEAVFIQESTYNSLKDLSQIIHEFI